MAWHFCAQSDMKKNIQLILFVIILHFTFSVNALEKIEMQALMPGMVVLLVDGSRVTLKTGKTIDGIKLISSTTKSAVLEVDGVKKTYQMGSAVSTQFRQRENISVRILRDQYGMFSAYGSINGQSVRFLVDTGATSVAMSANQARRLGLQYRLHGRPTKTSTASGLADAWSIRLKTVRLGQLIERNVQGIVVDGDYPRQVLLGLSFLNKMKVEKEGGIMVITRKK